MSEQENSFLDRGTAAGYVDEWSSKVGIHTYAAERFGTFLGNKK